MTLFRRMWNGFNDGGNCSFSEENKRKPPPSWMRSMAGTKNSASSFRTHQKRALISPSWWYESSVATQEPEKMHISSLLENHLPPRRAFWVNCPCHITDLAGKTLQNTSNATSADQFFLLQLSCPNQRMLMSVFPSVSLENFHLYDYFVSWKTSSSLVSWELSMHQYLNIPSTTFPILGSISWLSAVSLCFTTVCSELQIFGLHFSPRPMFCKLFDHSSPFIHLCISVCPANSKQVFNGSFMKEPTLSTP